MKWQIKVAAQKVLSVVPGATSLEAVGRRFVTRSTGLDDPQFRFRLEWSGLPYLRALADAYGVGRFADLAVYDAGCGWQPAVPFLLHAAGVRRQRLADVDRHLTARGCGLVDEAMRNNAAWLREQVPAAPLRVADRAAEGELEAILEARGMTYVQPESVAEPVLPDDLFDAAFCTGVFAYLQPAAVATALSNLARIVRPGGVIGVYVHLTDDFAGVDPTVGSFGFLRHEDEVWERRICSRRYYNNRYRLNDYLALFPDHGLDAIEVIAEPPTNDDLVQLSRLPLAARFSDRSPDDLGVRRFVALLAVPGSP